MATDKKRDPQVGTAPIINRTDFNDYPAYYGIFDRSKEDYYTKFSRIPIIDPYTALTGAKEYLFFTKPDLNIFSQANTEYHTISESGTTQGKNDSPPVRNGKYTPTPVTTFSYRSGTSRFDLNEELSSYPFFIEMAKRYGNVAAQLQASIGDKSSPFMHILSNAVKDTLDLPDITTREIDTPATAFGTAITYEADDFSTDENHTFSLEFEDSKYLEVYMLFKCWHEYLRRKSFGEVSPFKDEYRYKKILHDQIAIYKFIVGDDGETLIYWAKLYGCRPQGVPRQTFSDLNPSNGLRYSINWKAAFVEDMDPLILTDFNALTKSTRSNKVLPIYSESSEFGIDPTWASSAYIEEVDRRKIYGRNNPKSIVYKLRWTK